MCSKQKQCFTFLLTKIFQFRKIIYLLALMSSVHCFSFFNQYIVSLEGITKYQNYTPINFKLCNCNIYKITPLDEISEYLLSFGDPASIWKNNNPTLLGKIEKLNEWNRFTRAYAFQINDKVESIHSSSFFSWGSIFDSWKNFEIYDDSNNLLGYIQGEFSSEVMDKSSGGWVKYITAEFSFYNDKHEIFAKAIIHPTNPKLSIMSLDGQLLVRGDRYSSFESASKHKDKYFWKISIDDKISFDDRFLWPFIGFVAEVWFID